VIELVAERDGVQLKIIVADVRDLHHASELYGTIDAAFWSPPYKKKDGWTIELMAATGTLLKRALKRNSWAFMNFGQLKESFSRPFRSAAAVAGAGCDNDLIEHQVYIWLKSLAIDGTQRGHYQPLPQSKNLLHYCFEYVFGFHTGGKNPPPLDRLAVGCAFADKSNLTRGGRGKHGDLHCAGDVWFLPYSTTGATKKKAHPYEFPVELPEYALKLSGVKPGATVLDPFLGSGPTAIAARRLRLNCVGIERDEARARAALERWQTEDA
jgi:hypothetical protein